MLKDLLVKRERKTGLLVKIEESLLDILRASIEPFPRLESASPPIVFHGTLQHPRPCR